MKKVYGHIFMNELDHISIVEDTLNKAQLICDDNNLRLTPIRKLVLELILKTQIPSKAYEITKKINDINQSIQATSVYRALDFLLANGMIHRLESLNAFIGCFHPLKKEHSCYFMICNQCSNYIECCDVKIDHVISEKAKDIQFKMQSSILEVFGICAYCQNHS